MYRELFESVPKELWAVAVIIGNSIHWPLFTQDKRLAEQIARHHNTQDGIAGVMLGPLSIHLLNIPLVISNGESNGKNVIGSDNLEIGSNLNG